MDAKWDGLSTHINIIISSFFIIIIIILHHDHHDHYHYYPSSSFFIILHRKFEPRPFRLQQDELAQQAAGTEAFENAPRLARQRWPSGSGPEKVALLWLRISIPDTQWGWQKNLQNWVVYGFSR